MVKFALGIRGRNAGGRERSDGRDGVVADHAADFFHQIVLNRDVLGRAPARRTTENVRGAISSTLNSSDSRILRTSLGGTARPSLRSSQSSGKLDRLRRLGSGRRRRPGRRPAGFPARLPRSSSSARCKPRTVLTGSCAFSKRMEASVRSFSRDEVLRMLDALKFALSRTMRVVVSEMALSAPPITPASAIGAVGIGDHQIRWIERRRFRRSARRILRRDVPMRTMIWPP